MLVYLLVQLGTNLFAGHPTNLAITSIRLESGEEDRFVK